MYLCFLSCPSLRLRGLRRHHRHGPARRRDVEEGEAAGPQSIPYYTILYYTILYYTILYYTILYYTIIYYAMPCHAMPCHAMLYYTIMILMLYTVYDIPDTIYKRDNTYDILYNLRPSASARSASARAASRRSTASAKTQHNRDTTISTK